MTLFRVVPLRSLDARVAETLGLFVGLGTVLLGAVAVLAMVAAGQITAPVYALQKAAHLIAGGERPEPVTVETNDEFEDLAEDFNLMSDALHRHRSEMEALVDRRTAELRQAEAWLGELVRSSADAIVGLDRDGHITLWNRGARDLFGYTPVEVQGARLSDLIGAGSPREERFLQDELTRAGAVVGYSTRRRTKDGTSIPVSLTQTAVRRSGEAVIGYSVIFRDERPRELLESQMRSSERLAAISVMAAGLAHELNNPLSVIGNRIELMQRDAVRNGSDIRLRRDIEVLGTQVERIGAITGDLLRFAREDDAGSNEVDLEEVSERVLRLLRRLFVAEGIELEGKIESSLPPLIGSDGILETILVNLLLNARQATPSGGRVILECRRQPSGEVAIEVRDTGPGVPPELRRRIFEPFFTTRADQGGTGLGLAVCRALVDRMGIALEVDRAPEGGARFVLTLPPDPAIIQ
jgi:PAS domain S-box-containing protein